MRIDRPDADSLLSRSKAWMLGPKADNEAVFERLLLETLRDYCYWRRNFHPEDAAHVRAADRLSAAFQEELETLHDRLSEMLSHLKRSIPFFSPRYLGHMLTDLLMPGLLGYMAGLFYNQNNITEEAGTITVQFEAEAVQLLAQMLCLPETAWGHLCSGGTVANLEALWVARNLRLLPYEVALAIRTGSPRQARVLGELPIGDRGSVGDTLAGGRLHAIRIDEIAALQEGLAALCQGDPGLATLMHERSVANLGLAGFDRRCREALGAAYPEEFKILLSLNAHYSLRKSVGVLGLGEASLVPIPLDRRMRLDVAQLEAALRECEAKNACVLAVVGVYASTEEGCIDDFGEIDRIRREQRARAKGEFWLHGDACYGGYALSLLHGSADRETLGAQSVARFMQQVWDALGERASEARGDEGGEGVAWDEEKSGDWLRRSLAIGSCDSISIDPHKLGYVPFPAGAVLYRDYRVREAIRCDAPYLNAAQAKGEVERQIWQTPYLGKYTLEGSRPGATAAAVWLAHKTVPLDQTGHGLMVAQSILGARYLQRVLKRELRVEEGEGIGCSFMLDDPDLNVLCYTFPAAVDGRAVSLSVLNRCVEILYRESLPTESHPTSTRQFVVAMTSLDVAEYGGLLEEILATLPVRGRLVAADALATQGNPWRDDHKITVVRTVMGPFLLQGATRPRMREPERDLALEYAQFLRTELRRILEGLLNAPLPEPQRPPLPGNVLILEESPERCDDLAVQLREKGFRGGPGRIFTARDCREGVQRARDESIAAALLHLEPGADERAGTAPLLETLVRNPAFKGAIVFSRSPDEATRGGLEQLANRLSGERWAAALQNGPPPRSHERFQSAMNGMMEDLWDMLNGNGAAT